MSPCPPPSRRRPLGSRLVGLLGALALALAYVVGTPLAPAQAADWVSVALTSISPRIATTNATVTLSGTVTNTSTTTLTGVQAYLWRDQEVRTTRDRLTPTGGPVGARYLPSFVVLGTNGTLTPGQTAAFTVAAPLSALAIPARDGVTMVGVQIRGSHGDGNITLGRGRAWLPQDLGAQQAGVPIASVVVLTSTPSRVAPNTFIDDHLAAEVAPGGRLDTLLRTAGEAGRTYLIDPALIIALDDMAGDGYALTDGTKGTGQAAAKAWLAQFDALSTTGYRLPYGAADVDVFGAAQRPDLMQKATAATILPADVSHLPLAVWPGGGTLTASGLSVLSDIGTQATVLVSNVDHNPTTAGGGSIVVPYDPQALTAGPDDNPTDAQQRQASAATAFLDGLAGRNAQVRLITDAATARIDDLDTSTRTPLSDLPIRGGGPLTAADLRLTEAGPVAHTNDVVVAAKDRDGLDSLFSDPALAADMTTRLVSSLASTQWAGHAQAYQAFHTWEQTQARSILTDGALTISARPVLLTAQQDTQFPVTVTNHLTVPVSVRLQFESENAERLHVPPIDIPTIGAGEAIGVVALPQVQANGHYTVVAQLTTPSGRPIGRTVDIDVQATQAGRVGWILMLVSGIVVIGTTVLRVKQVRAERSRA